MTMIANIYAYILDDKFGIQNPQRMVIGKLMNSGCVKENPNVYKAIKQVKKEKASSSHRDSKKQRSEERDLLLQCLLATFGPTPTQKTKYRRLLSFFLLSSKVFES